MGERRVSTVDEGERIILGGIFDHQTRPDQLFKGEESE